MDERIFIERLINLIEKQSNRGPVEEWTNHNFFLLSCDIEEKTGHRISESTLKRILGKKKTSKRYYNPQIQTKDILANYLDYANWHAFKNDLTGAQKNLESSGRKTVRKTQRVAPSPLWYIAVPAISIVLLLIFTRGDKEISFTPREYSGEIPYTAIFDYDIGEIRDSVFVDFGNYEIFWLDPGKKMINEFYRSAAVPEITVYTGKKELKKLRLHNRSGSWQSGSSPNDTIQAYRPFEPQPDFINGDTLYIPPAIASELGVNTGKPHWIEFRKTDDFGISLDSIEFTCSIRNSPETGGRRCYDAEIYLLGSKSSIRLKFIEPGCFSFVNLQFSEKKFNGRFEDLSSFAVDLDDWGAVRIKTRPGYAEVHFNGDTIFTQEYMNPLGELWGIIFRFYGSGAVRNIALQQGS